MDIILFRTVGLLVAAVLVALIARRLHLPYTVGLAVSGIALAFAGVGGGAVLTHDFIFDVILPPLLFEAAINIHWRELRRDALPVLTLAILGTVIAAAVVAGGMAWLLGWPPPTALLFGVLIAATDPVAVIAMFKDNGITGRLRLLVESESLFNDGIAAVLFALMLAWVETTGGPEASPVQAMGSLLFNAGGGVAVGLGCGVLAIGLARGTLDHLVESTLTAVSAYGSFLLAEHLHCSGVLATVAAGLVVGNAGVLAKGEDGQVTERGREFTLALWDFIAFIANSLVFLMIGVSVAKIPFHVLGTQAMAVTIGLVLLSRAVSVYPLCGLFGWSRWRVRLGEQHVLWWGGLRGALGLALALSLPPSLPYRGEILVATFGVVAFSVIAQGLTMPLLLRRLGLAARSGSNDR